MMIKAYKSHNYEDLIKKLKKVSMLKNDNNFPYLNSYITIETIDPNCLYPCQFYIIKNELQSKIDLCESFDTIGVNIFLLTKYYEFKLENEKCIRTILPPIVEESIESDGKIYPLINDGMHRIYLALLQKRKINVIYIRGSSEPYYAYPLTNSWSDVSIINELNKNTIKKIHRIQDNKKLYRNFDSVFMNCSRPRGINNI